MCLFADSRPSVSVEVRSATLWMLMHVIAETLAYVYTAHVPNDDVRWTAHIFVVVTAFVVWVGLHRMKVARIRLSIEEGETEWSYACCNFFVALGAFGASAVVALRNPVAFSHEHMDDHEFRSMRVMVHVMFSLTVVFDFLTYVFMVRFERKANDLLGHM
jgi:hypothetical protein